MSLCIHHSSLHWTKLKWGEVLNIKVLSFSFKLVGLVILAACQQHLSKFVFFVLVLIARYFPASHFFKVCASPYSGPFVKVRI